jgi:tetratricopeptide (TPR) repeat protein
MSPRARVVVLTAAAALLAAAVAVAAATIPDSPRGRAAVAPAPQPREGAPPLALDLGLRDDAEARDLRRAAALYDQGKRARAAAIFARHESLEARVGDAFAHWPDGTVDRLGQLAGLYPRSALVQVNLGLALFWANEGGSSEAWRAAIDGEPDTPYAVMAGDFLHPRDMARGLPMFTPSFEVPARIARLDGQAQLDALRDAASSGGAREKLLYGVALQRLGRPVSAARAYAAAARAAPGDPEAQVAAAVGRFDKDSPSIAFSQLGPLARRYPKAATVRFHLGVMLLWTGRLTEARRQLRLAESAEPGSVAARESRRYLDSLAKIGTG